MWSYLTPNILCRCLVSLRFYRRYHTCTNYLIRMNFDLYRIIVWFLLLHLNHTYIQALCSSRMYMSFVERIRSNFVTLLRSRFSDVTQRSLGKRYIRHPIKRPWRGLVIYGELFEWSNLKKESLKWSITTCLIDVTAMTAIHQHFLFQQTTLPTATFEWLLQEFHFFSLQLFSSTPRHKS